jgi:hypothetical protein
MTRELNSTEVSNWAGLLISLHKTPDLSPGANFAGRPAFSDAWRVTHPSQRSVRTAHEVNFRHGQTTLGAAPCDFQGAGFSCGCMPASSNDRVGIPRG